MTRRKTTDLNHRLRKVKAALLAVSLTLAGILLMMLNGWIEHLKLGDWEWLHSIPLGELGGTLKVILGVSWVISGRRYDDGPPPWGIMGVKETSP